MFGLSPIHLIFFAVVVLILFGKGRISEFMGDFGKGIKSFKQGMAEEDSTRIPSPPVQIPAEAKQAASGGEQVAEPAAAPGKSR